MPTKNVENTTQYVENTTHNVPTKNVENVTKKKKKREKTHEDPEPATTDP